ncbi:acetate--CoA ligase family protein [Rhodococcus sp. IEGM 1379]|uniref:acetate--CoA ligase family protein n=1 Tax=Rhodococcus sp. IEGM 1379 TaxID=3047086 RepID=UPI0024B65B04|nr:acetate--CoA ligase family protein [Rhodococcus sp. IEGM 1379]MDI9915367.1 acetate--CoA ligase family protein [Rhodococcus sp. IEGM 1379]
MTTSSIVFPDLSYLVRPRSIAVVGASDKPGSIGYWVLHNLVEASDFSGDIYPVNPKRELIGGITCYPGVEQLPVAADVALIVIPAAGVLDALEQCASRGILFAIVFTSGFGESGEEGLKQQQRMREIAEQSGMRIYGPNCPGFVNLADNIGMTLSPAFAADQTSGPLGIATQGGGLGRNLIQASSRGARSAMWASLGNSADLSVADFIHHLSTEDEVKVIIALLEGVDDGPRLIAALNAAAAVRKPVVAMKIGQSEYGEKAVQSHTSSMAVSGEINSVVFEQYGVIEAHDMDELIDVAWLLTRAAPPVNPKIAVFGSSGGALALAADMVGTAGLELSEFTDETLATLERVLPGFASIVNPVDTTASVISDIDLFQQSLLAVANDPNVDVILAPMPLDYGDHSLKSSEMIVEAQKLTSIPIIPVWMSDSRGEGYQVLAEAGFGVTSSLSKTLLALRRWADYGQWRAMEDEFPAPSALALSAPAASAVLPDVSTERKAKNWLAEQGITVPQSAIVTTEAEARSVSGQFDGPLVMKIESADIAHKSDVGGVIVGVHGSDAVAAAREQILAAVATNCPDAHIGGVLIEEMVPDDGVEMIVGVHRDPVYGHMLTVGLGGIYVEIFQDVQRGLLPLDEHRVREMLAKLKSLPLLTGVRGRPACDIDGLVKLLLGVSDLITAYGDHIDEIELNPVRVRPIGSAGHTVAILDALIVPRVSQ